MQHPHAEIELQIANSIEYLAAVVNAETLADYGELHRSLLDALNARMESIYAQLEEKEPGSAEDQIAAEEVTLMVKSPATQRLYARRLPMDYKENSNGISIHGEDLKGNPSNIVFISGNAVEKIKDLLGQGWEKPRCNHDD